MTDVRVTVSFEVVAESIVVGNGRKLPDRAATEETGEIKRGRDNESGGGN